MHQHQRLQHYRQWKSICQKGAMFCLVICGLVSHVIAQNQLDKPVTVSVNQQKISQFISLLQKEAGITFSYSPNGIRSDRLVTYNATGKKLSQVLEESLKPLSISYRFDKNQILLFATTDEKANVKETLTVNPSANVVNGTVTNEKGEPMVGVTISVSGSSAMAVTNEKGVYSIRVVSDADSLRFSYSGYQSTAQVAGNTGTVNIGLMPQEHSLDAVVVVGYGTQRKGDVTGSVASVNNKEFKSLPVTSAGEALQGRAAGVQVVSSGAPGSNVSIRIRGTGSINNSDPLLVIDGVPTDVPLNTISPDDIQSMEILKDASASAIYGSRGANGVVLITTKRGVSGQSHLEFKSFAGVQNPTNMVKLLNASQFASLNNEMLAANGQPQNPAYANPPNLGTGTNWLGELFRPAGIQNYSMAYSGGSAKSTYYVSGSYLNQDGIVINTGYKRYTVQFNSDNRVFDWLRFGNNITLNHDDKKQGSYSIRDAMAALPVQPVFNADGTYSGPIGQASWYGDILNPVGKATINQQRTQGNNIVGNIYGEVTLFKDLKFKTTGGIQASFFDSRSWAPKYDFQPLPQANAYLFEQYNKSITLLWDNYFTYDKRFGGNDHHVTVLAGSSAQNNRFDYMNGSITNFASATTQQLNNGSTQPTVGGSASEWALFSFIGRVNYDYQGKYLFTGTVRRDGSSRFGVDNRYGIFPSGSVAWRISKEKFFENVRLINDLKLRVGYGITGNQNIGNYSFASVLQTIQYNFNGTPVSAVVPLVIPNPGVRWEQVEQANIGLDVSLLHNRITITADAYLKNTNDMLVPASIPISTGYSDIFVPSINAGKVQNKGIELGITTQNITGKFEWSSSFNFSYNQNKIISLNDSVPLPTGSIGLSQNLALQKAGYAINSFYGFVTNGIFQTQKEIDGYSIQVPGADPFNRTSPGDIRFRDLNNDGKIDDNDRTFIGNPNPKVIFAMNNSFSYKGFDLSVFLQGVSGNSIFNANRVYQEGMSVAQNQTTRVLDRWHGEGTSNDIPRAVFNDPNKNTRVSNRFIEDGSYMRIKNVVFGYTLPKRISQSVKLSSARIYFTCQNLLTFTNYTGFDPEVGSNGIDFSVYPVTRTISGGINLIF